MQCDLVKTLLSVEVNFHTVLVWASPTYTVPSSEAAMSWGMSKCCANEKHTLESAGRGSLYANSPQQDRKKKAKPSTTQHAYYPSQTRQKQPRIPIKATLGQTELLIHSPGTGSAPHNPMYWEMLRDTHHWVSSLYKSEHGAEGGGLNVGSGGWVGQGRVIGEKWEMGTTVTVQQ